MIAYSDGHIISGHKRLLATESITHNYLPLKKLVMENFRKFSQVETFPTMFAHRFLLAYFTLSMFRDIFTGIICFYCIIYVSGKFPEIFITRKRAYTAT
jgi:hypothetical protein